MRTFKLIFWYPGLSELKVGDLVTKVDSDSFYTKEMFHVPYTEVENNPTFWEEVTLPKPAEYRVVAVKGKNGKPSSRYNPDTNKVIWDTDSKPKWHDINLYLNSPDYDIYSVERVSDGVRFTIGDVVQHSSLSSDRGIITNISHTIPNYFTVQYQGVHHGDKFLFINSIPYILHLEGTPIYIEGGHCIGTIDKGILKISKYAL